MTRPLTPGRPETAPAEIGRRLRLLRLAHGLSVRRFAGLIDLDHSALSKIERGARDIATSHLFKLYGAIDGSADFLLFGRQSGLTGDMRDRIRELEREASDASDREEVAE